MTDQFYFATLAGIALSAAGFAGLVTALRGDGHWSRTELWRLRNIVQSSLMIVLVSLLPVPIYRGVGGDEMLVIRIICWYSSLHTSSGRRLPRARSGPATEEKPEQSLERSCLSS